MSARTVVRLVLGVLGLLTAPLPTTAQHAVMMPRVGILSLGSAADDVSVAALRHGLQALGYVEGQNITLVVLGRSIHTDSGMVS